MGIHYLQMALVQFAIQIVFDLFPLSIVLIGNPMSATKRNTNWISAYAMKTKIECVNGMNGWTATDQCVRPFMWWTTLVIAGYFSFFFFYALLRGARKALFLAIGCLFRANNIISLWGKGI